MVAVSTQAAEDKLEGSGGLMKTEVFMDKCTDENESDRQENTTLAVTLPPLLLPQVILLVWIRCDRRSIESLA